MEPVVTNEVKVKLAIGIPNQGQISTETFFSLYGAIEALDDTLLTLCGQSGALVHWTRNDIFATMRQQGNRYLVFFDTDMSFPPDTIKKLIALGKPVVGVNSFKKMFPKQSTVHVLEQRDDGKWKARNAKNGDIPLNPFNKIDGQPIGVGTGIMLIDLEATKDIEPPWFKADWRGPGEDLFFCSKVLQAGLEVWCDPTIDVGHMGSYRY